MVPVVLSSEDPPEWYQTLQRWHLIVPGQILLIVVLALIGNLVARRAIGHGIQGAMRVRDLVTVDDEDMRAQRRADALAGVFKGLATGLIVMIAIFAVLSELGINVASFVTAATIIGGALAFGAQQLVRDLLAGMFVVAEDQYGVGDTVDLGLAIGTVERITLRATKLRDDQGRVWHVPNGQVQRAGNLSQGWSKAILDVPIALHADIGEAADRLDAVARELYDVPTIGPLLLEPPEVLGVQSVGDDRAVLRVTIKTKPGQQVPVVRELRLHVIAARADGRLPMADLPATLLVRQEPVV